MSVQLIADNAEGVLSAAVTAGDTTFSMTADYDEFPSPGTDQHFYVTVGDDSSNEIRKVTARTDGTFTCDAFVSGWPIDTPVFMAPNSESMSEFVQLDGAQILQKKTMKGNRSAYTAYTIASGVLTLDYEQGPVFDVTLDQDVTSIVINNAPSAGETGGMIIRFIQNSTGGYSITFSASLFQWGTNSDGEQEPPELNTDANAVNEMVFVNYNGETLWTGGAFAIGVA